MQRKCVEKVQGKEFSNIRGHEFSFLNKVHQSLTTEISPKGARDLLYCTLTCVKFYGPSSCLQSN